MNVKQKEIMEKEFKVNEHFSISRGDYENMPCSMFAWKWSDKRMEELASNIAKNLCPYDENDEEGMEDDFWKTMEDEAVRMGMEYYEDFEDDYIAEIEYDWINIK